jgi:hypothetical protein
MESKLKVLADAKELDSYWQSPYARKVLKLLIRYMEAESQAYDESLINQRDAALIEARDALEQILDDGQHISDYAGEYPNERPIFNRNEKQGYYCYAAAEQAMASIIKTNEVLK